MSKQLNDVLAVMINSRSDLGLLARGQVVDAKEVSEALSKSAPDTVERVCLEALSKYNPYENPEYNRPADVPAPATPDQAESVV